VWDLPRRPVLTRAAEAVLNPLVGKSVAMYFGKPSPAQVIEPAMGREAARGSA
jgi:hypothetical protein